MFNNDKTSCLELRHVSGNGTASIYEHNADGEHFDHIANVLPVIKRFLHGMGYEWVDAVQIVGRALPNGEVTVHSSED